MKAYAVALSLLIVAQPALGAPDAPYYGPMIPWHGISIAFKYGYRDHEEIDGTWRIEVALRHGQAIDMAVYRAADLAREHGYSYLQYLGGKDDSSPGHESATVWVRLAQEPAAPTGCRSTKRGTCYTANVAEVLRVLGGPGGTQPGVAIVDHLEEHGLQVFLGGYGAGDVTKMPVRTPLPVAEHPIPYRARTALPVPLASRAVKTKPVLSEAERYRAALKAAQPM